MSRCRYGFAQLDKLTRDAQAKKGVTKRCPVCDDDIPVRLLQSHTTFELERLEELAKQVPDDVELPSFLDNTTTPGAG